MVTFGGYRTMWLIVMFDLPTYTAEARRGYTLFRKFLLADGFIMMQYSVYMRHCASEENSTVHIRRIKTSLPPDGEVRIVTFTDKQFERMQVFYGKKAKKAEQAPNQLSFF